MDILQIHTIISQLSDLRVRYYLDLEKLQKYEQMDRDVIMLTEDTKQKIKMVEKNITDLYKGIGLNKVKFEAANIITAE